MADQSKPTSPTIQERLKAIVGTIQASIVQAPRFRPADVALAKDYDDFAAGLLDALVELSAVAAVDKLATSVAIELSRQRKEFALLAQKQRDDSDAVSKDLGGQIAASLLGTVPFEKGTA